MKGRWLNAYAVFTAFATLFLIFAGGLVTSTGSGLSVPDWPLSYGMVWPPMVGGVFYEHGHRTVAATVGLLTVILALALWRKESRRWVRRLGWLAVVAVCLQGLLGGLTVIFLLPLPVSVAHACLAQAFLCLVVAIAVATSRSFMAAPRSETSLAGRRLRRLAGALTACIYVQLVLGAIMRHLDKMSIDRDGPALAIPDFPLSFGRVVPPLGRLAEGGVLFHFTHRLMAVGVTTLAVVVLVEVYRRHAAERALLLPAVVLTLAFPGQVTLGAFTVWSQRAVLPTTFHVATGALILAASLVLSIQSFRRYAPVPARLAASESSPSAVAQVQS